MVMLSFPSEFGTLGGETRGTFPFFFCPPPQPTTDAYAYHLLLLQELRDFAKDPVPDVTLEMVDDQDLRHFIGIIRGPEDSPYSGGRFHLDIQLPEEYPFSPPKIKFTTRVWHPNVSSQTGAICLDILKDRWSAAMSLRTAMLSIQALLMSPEPSDPQDAEVARMYMNDRPRFDAMALHWTQSYAMGKGESDKVAALVAMGFPSESCRKALEEHQWDENAALEMLLSGA